MPLFLETERLALRPFAEADVDHLVDLDSDPEVMRFLGGGRPTSRVVALTSWLSEVLRPRPPRAAPCRSSPHPTCS
jgi:RimJ/RimL family protein N-acetyltransferase